MTEQSKDFMFGSEQEIEELGSGIKRQILGFNNEIMMVKVWFEKGSIGAVHKHKHSQTTYVVSGEFDVFINGTTKNLKSGDAFYIEPMLDHGAVCTKAGILIDVFSPVREDFLEGKSYED